MKTNPPLVALLIFLSALALYTLAVSPLSTSLARTRARLTDDETTLSSMQTDVSMKDSLAERVAQLESTNAAHRAALIQPMLNSYAMRGKSYLDRIAQESGLTGLEYTEGTFRALPVPKTTMPERRTARRSVKVRASGDYAAVASFVLRVEHEIGLAALQSLSIRPQTRGANVGNDLQEVALVFEWPCEGEVIR